ncbi:hypothetical protein AK812_SmicGene46689 [Symbiodinium microadriaticum]|uniref:Uncharacterized protein n=1 Tax=Symbiodinium microadriaticum TaxID=2951 RepID=A0A1Q9BTH8_SYMMI|nr:hypothetical protein AK812_SmicGene46689 [Symbiodinium microadriaticum]
MDVAFAMLAAIACPPRARRAGWGPEASRAQERANQVNEHSCVMPAQRLQGLVSAHEPEYAAWRCSAEQGYSLRTFVTRGKNRIWNAAGEAPANMSDIGHAWQKRGAHLDRRLDSPPPSPTPLGTDEHVASSQAGKKKTQQRLPTLIPDVPDLQGSWLLLHSCATP